MFGFGLFFRVVELFFGRLRVDRLRVDRLRVDRLRVDRLRVDRLRVECSMQFYLLSMRKLHNTRKVIANQR